MDGGGGEPSEGAEELDTAGKDYETGGIQSTGLWDVIQCGGAGSSVIRIRDLGADPCMGQALRSFQHRVARRITGSKRKQLEDGAGKTTSGDSNGGGGV